MEQKLKPLNLELDLNYGNRMKRWIYGILILFLGCAPSELDDCFRSAGSTITKAFEVSAFSKIRFENDVILNVQQGTSQKVEVTSGSKLFENITVVVEGETLVIKDENSCNLVRDYGLTQVLVTTDTLTEIRNSSAYDVRSIGVLGFPSLVLRSDSSGGVEDSRKSGDFYLNLDCKELRVQANGQSVFYLEGMAENAVISFADEYPRFEGGALAIDTLTVFHRGANKMIVRPKHLIQGRIVGVGDVIALERPAVVDVTEEFTGRLRFQ